MINQQKAALSSHFPWYNVSMNRHIYQEKHTPVSPGMQLLLPLDVEFVLSKEDPARVIDAFVNELSYEEVYCIHHPPRGNSLFPEILLLKVCLMAATLHHTSSRKIEELCRYDLRFRWLLQGHRPPDHTTLWRFKTRFAPKLFLLLRKLSRTLFEKGFITDEHVFIDGTKMEAAAGRYTFVWKKAVLKYLEKLEMKLPGLLEEAWEELGEEVSFSLEDPEAVLGDLLEASYAKKEKEGILFVYGKGKRKAELQRLVETLEDSLEKIRRYKEQIALCGEKRNSYSKTDPDATFMRMKDDHMRNGQLKPAYNLQLAVSSEFIIGLDVSQERTDYHRLPAMLEELKELFGYPVKAVVADAGYDCEENHLYCRKEGTKAYIKPQYYEQKKKRASRKNPKLKSSMIYDEQKDEYTCLGGQKLVFQKEITQKTKSGLEQKLQIYEAKSCESCPLKPKCTTSKTNRRIQINRRLDQWRAESEELILSEKGINLRINRSIQAEGAFASIKNQRGCRRLHHFGMEKVEAELYWEALGHNFMKWCRKREQDRLKQHLHLPKN